MRCFAKLDMLLLLLCKAVSCSLYRVENCLPVCTTYVLLQSVQVNLYTPHNESLSGAWFLWVSMLPIVFVVRNSILSSVHLKMLVMYKVSLPT